MLYQTEANDAELLYRSGLDSTTAMHLLTSLRALAKGGRSIITTIHQPSSRLYQQLDKLLLLSQVSAVLHVISVVDLGRGGQGIMRACSGMLPLLSGEHAD